MDVVIALFSRLASEDERKIGNAIDDAGGLAAVRQDDDALKTLITIESSVRVQRRNPTSSSQALADPRREKGAGGEKSLSLDDLKVELREDVDDALARNLQTFVGKFELQIGMLQAALERYIRAENDRVIDAVTGAMAQGPHTKIRDPVGANLLTLLVCAHYIAGVTQDMA